MKLEKATRVKYLTTLPVTAGSCAILPLHIAMLYALSVYLQKQIYPPVTDMIIVGVYVSPCIEAHLEAHV